MVGGLQPGVPPGRSLVWRLGFVRNGPREPFRPWATARPVGSITVPNFGMPEDC